MTEKLKSCPFCPNGEGKLRKIHTNWGYGYRVTCQNCLATGSAGYSDRFKTDDDMEKFAIEAWNTRAADENPALTLGELKKISHDTTYKQKYNQWIWIDLLNSEGIPGSPKSAYYKSNTDYTEEEAFCCGYPVMGFHFEYEDYNKTWLAYRRKPEDNKGD